MYTRNRPGSEMSIVTFTPLVPMASLATCSMMISLRAIIFSICEDGLCPCVGITSDDVQIGVFLQADVHEGAGDARQDIFDFALIDVSDDLFRLRAFDQQLDQLVILQHGHPGFLGRAVDQDFAFGVLDRIGVGRGTSRR